MSVVRPEQGWEGPGRDPKIALDLYPPLPLGVNLSVAKTLLQKDLVQSARKHVSSRPVCSRGK